MAPLRVSMSITQLITIINNNKLRKAAQVSVMKCEYNINSSTIYDMYTSKKTDF